MIPPPQNSTSTATSGAISRPAAAPAAALRATRKRRPAAAPPVDEAVENAGAALAAAAAAAELPPASNTGNGETCCSMGNEEADSPLKTKSGKAPKPATKVTTRSTGHAPDSSSRRRDQNHLVGPVFSKPAFVLVGVLVLVTMVWKWSNTSANSGVPEITTAIQVKELEDFSKKTTKWMQVQLELVDMKIGREVEGLRKEVEEKLEEQSLALGSSVRNLQAQVEGMDSTLQKLVDGGLLSKKDGVQLIHSIIQQRSEEESGRALSLDDVRMAARQIVEAELEKHSADGIGRVDYALGSGGGKVLEHSEASFSGGKTSWLSVLGAGLSAGGAVKHPLAHKVLEPSFGQPGQCLPLKGSDVFLEIALRTHIHPDAITIEHVPKSVAYDVSSAPKDFRVFGWLERGIHADSIGKPVKKLLLGEFRYSVEGPSIQTFSLPEEVQHQLVNTVRVHVTSNHGSSSHTCIYRIRMHGFEAAPQL